MIKNIEQISIANRIIDRIEDEEGTYWYPLKAFFTRILLKKEVTIAFRDSNLSRYMQVFKYTPINAPHEVNVWCMNELGIKYILKRLSVAKSHNEELTELRKKNLSEACLYFGINRVDDLKPNYLEITPNLKGYDFWSLLCINNDQYINSFTRWHRCSKCKYYYPYNSRYFFQEKRKLTHRCLQCCGKNFKCQNKIIQYIYDNDGFDLLFSLENNDEDEKIVRRLNDFINKGGYIKNDD